MDHNILGLRSDPPVIAAEAEPGGGSTLAVIMGTIEMGTEMGLLKLSVSLPLSETPNLREQPLPSHESDSGVLSSKWEACGIDLLLQQEGRSDLGLVPRAGCGLSADPSFKMFAESWCPQCIAPSTLRSYGVNGIFPYRYSPSDHEMVLDGDWLGCLRLMISEGWQ